MPTAEPRYNATCRIHDCDRWRRSDDIVCRHHYELLPKGQRWRLWNPQTSGDITLALEMIEEAESK